MIQLIMFLFCGLIFSQVQIDIDNIKSIEFNDGGWNYNPSFSPNGEYLAVEEWGGGSIDRVDMKTWIIDLNNINNKIRVKKSLESKKSLHCNGLQWSMSDPDYAYIKAILNRRTRFYKLNYRNLLDKQENYLIEWTGKIFGIGTKGNEIHSYALSEYGGDDIIIFCYYDKMDEKDLYGILSDGTREIILQGLESPYVQMEINSVDDGYLSLIRTDSENNPEIIIMEDPVDESDSQIFISPYKEKEKYIVYEKKLNINTSDQLYLSYLAKREEDKKNKVTNLYIVEEPFNNTIGEKVVESVHLVDKGTEQLLNFNHQWHPEYNIIFYIKRLQENDHFVLYAYHVDENREIVVNMKIEGIQHVAISPDGKKISLCDIVPGRLWVGDLVIK